MTYRAFLEWARATRIPLPTPLDATDDLRVFLAEALADARILFVGEADHWIHEKADYRLALTAPAVDLGFRWVGEELGWSDGTRLDRFLHHGLDDELERISLYGFRGDRRPDRDDSPTGILRASHARLPDPAFTAEHRRWIRRLRRLDTVRYFGFDVDAAPGGAYADLGLDRVAGESLEEEIARLSRLLDGEADPERRTALTTLRDSLVYISLAHPAPTYEALNPAMALRERVMQRHLDHVLRRLPSGARLVLYGHDLHLARDDDAIESPGGGAGPGGREAPSLGHHLNARYRDRIYVVWMVIGGGEDSQPFDELDRTLAPPAHSLNGLLRQVGGSFFLPTRDAPALRVPRRLYHLYNTHATLTIADQADAVVFLESVTPMRAS